LIPFPISWQNCLRPPERLSADAVVKKVKGFDGVLGPMKPLRTLLTTARERSSQFGITEHPIHRCAKILDRIGVDMNGRFTRNFRQAGIVRSNDGCARCHRLYYWQSEAFIERIVL
jgi:hypothetical protein